jgi:FtsH-binding integral membrane protein
MQDYTEQPYYSNQPAEIKQDSFNSDDFQPEDYVRKGFIKKVYGILLIQLAISLLFISVGTLFKKDVEKFVVDFIPLYFIAGIGAFVTLILLCCCKSLARSAPINYVLLLIFTVCESYLLMIVSCAYEAKVVFSAVALTVACTLGLTVYAWTTKKDFTPLVAWLWAVLFTFVFCGLLFFCFNQNVYILYCGCGVLIYSIYIIIDTQLLLGKFQHEFNTEDYVFAAMNLYLDIINLFLYILRILGKAK